MSSCQACHFHTLTDPKAPLLLPRAQVFSSSHAGSICASDNSSSGSWSQATFLWVSPSFQSCVDAARWNLKAEQLPRQVLANMEEAASLTGHVRLSLSQLLENIWALMVDALRWTDAVCWTAAR